jgi:hypothetical protein
MDIDAGETLQETAALLHQISVGLLQQIDGQADTAQLVDANVNALDLKEAATRLSKVSTPNVVMQLLASFLFAVQQGPNLSSDNNKQSSDDVTQTQLSSTSSLAVLTFLCTSAPQMYLKPASRAVRSCIESLQLEPYSSAGEGESENNNDVRVVVTPQVGDLIASELSSSDVEVSSNASASILMLCRKFPHRLVDPCLRAVLSKWQQVLSCTAQSQLQLLDRNQASTISIRCAAAIVNIACLSESNMELATLLGCTDILIQLLTDGSDPLVQMSIMDLLQQMASTYPMHGARVRWLFRQEVVVPLIDMAGGGSSSSGEVGTVTVDLLLSGPALKLLSSFFKAGQTDASLFGGLEGNTRNVLIPGFRKALHNFDSDGEVGRLAFVDAVSSFASASPDALEMTLDDPFLREKWLSLRSIAQPKLKSVILTSMAQVIDPPKLVDAHGDHVTIVGSVPSNALVMRLYQTLGSMNSRNSTELLLVLAKTPIVELRLGVYELMRAVAKRGAGGAHQMLSSTSQFYEFLVNRDTETVKECKEAKFRIIEAVLSSDVKSLLADDIVANLEKMVKQGPFYVKSISWEMATE